MEGHFTTILNRAVDRVDRGTLANSDPKIIIAAKILEDLKLLGLDSISEREYDGETICPDTILDFFEARPILATDEVLKKRDILFEYFKRILEDICKRIENCADHQRRSLYAEYYNMLIEEINRD